jgi:1-acyl-sn-glycerol-3-phosphate acyltransferase
MNGAKPGEEDEPRGILMFELLTTNLTIGGARFLTGIEARWVGCCPDDVQRIYFANHTSHMDFVLLCSALPARIREKTRPVAASDYWNRGIVRQYIIHRAFRAVVIDRKCSERVANPIEPMIEALDRGESLVLFTEGTRGTGEHVQPFKCGIFHLASARPHIELIPVWIDNSYRVMPKGTAVPIPLLCSAAFGQPMRIGPDEPKEIFLARSRQALLDLSNQ